jgi:hypothetical protein
MFVIYRAALAGAAITLSAKLPVATIDEQQEGQEQKQKQYLP